MNFKLQFQFLVFINIIILFHIIMLSVLKIYFCAPFLFIRKARTNNTYLLINFIIFKENPIQICIVGIPNYIHKHGIDEAEL